MNDSQKNPQPETFRSRRRPKQAPTANQDNPLDTLQPTQSKKRRTQGKDTAQTYKIRGKKCEEIPPQMQKADRAKTLGKTKYCANSIKP
jgi:hypothetical protein